MSYPLSDQVIHWLRTPCVFFHTSLLIYFLPTLLVRQTVSLILIMTNVVLDIRAIYTLRNKDIFLNRVPIIFKNCKHECCPRLVKTHLEIEITKEDIYIMRKHIARVSHTRAKWVHECRELVQIWHECSGSRFLCFFPSCFSYKELKERIVVCGKIQKGDEFFTSFSVLANWPTSI